MATTPFRSGSLKSLSSTRTAHDGHVDGNLNCIALRHGWSRPFTITPEEIPTLDYAALEDILELNTLKLRPVGLRIFIEHPPDSNQWAKVRPWKQNTSLVSLLLNDFFEHRRRDGIVLRIDVRDGHERPVINAGNSFASAVGSFIAGSVRSERQREQIDKAWWRPGRDRLLSASTSTNATRRGAAAETEDETGLLSTPPPKLKKPSFFSFLAPAPKLPPQTLQEPERRRSIFDWFRRQSSIPKGINPVSHHAREGELEQLRKAGWKPPPAGVGPSPSPTSTTDAGARTSRKASLNDHLQSYERGEGAAARRPNPFFGGTRGMLNRDASPSNGNGTAISNPRGVNIFARMDSMRRGSGSGSSGSKGGMSRAERKKDKGKQGKGIADAGSGEEDASEFIGYDPFGESPFSDDAAIAELFLRHTAASSNSGAPSMAMSKVQPLKSVEAFKATTIPPPPPVTIANGSSSNAGIQPLSAFHTGTGTSGGTRSRNVSFDNKTRTANGETAVEMVDAKEMEHEHEYVSDYFEIERESSILETNSRPSKPWQRFQTFNKTPKEKPDKNDKDRGDGKKRRPGSPARLGSGAQIVSRPMDAFPHSPHHRMMEAEAEGAVG